jgi:tetratricopeptide (TPR) repeat protein
MRRTSPILLPVVTVVLASVLASTDAFAQGMGGGMGAQEESRAEAETRRTPAMRERVYTRLAEAQECAEVDDVECAQQRLAQVREMDDLNSYETAQMWNFYAFIYFGQDNYREAIRAYEMVLEQPELPLGMEQTTMYTLCQLYFQQERYDDSLAMLDRWFGLAEEPGADPYVLRAQLFYSLQRFEEGIEPVLTAIGINQELGRAPRENWYRLLNVFYYELEDYENVIDVLRTMIEIWPKREYFVQLSAMYGQEGNDAAQMGLYEVAHEAGWLTRGNELIQMAQLLLQADVPIRAAKILEAALDSGTVESNERNWRLLAQSWQLAQEDLKAVPAMTRAAGMAEDGTLNVNLAQSYQNLYEWEDCAEAARNGIRKGDLRREDQAYMILGACLFELKEYSAARTAFEDASEDERSRGNGRSWIQYVNAEESRDRELAAALAR